MTKYNSRCVQSAIKHAQAESARLNKEMAVVSLTGDLYHVMTSESAENLGVEVIGLVTPMAIAMERTKHLRE